MKILITGMTNANVKGQMVKTGVYTQSHMYREGLKKLGHWVTNEKPDEDELTVQVESHDSFLVGLSSIGSITAGWRIPTLAMIGKILIEDKKLITFVDDWQFPSIMPGLQNLLIDDKLKRMAERDVNMGRLHPTFFSDWEHEITTGLCALAESNHTMLSSILDFGNSNDEFSKLSSNPILIDPSCYQPIPEYVESSKDRQWVIAGLADYSKYVKTLKCSWPVKQIGQKIDGRFVSNKETEVFKSYFSSLGVLIPTYKSSNTNWWRPRYLFARNFRNIVFSQPGTTGLHEEFNVPVNEIELMSDKQLKDLLNSQIEKMNQIVWPEERFLEVLGSQFS